MTAAAEAGIPRRFGGVARLYGRGGYERLRAARVCVVGVGGVGGWTAEALGRTGLGHITLIDLDDVCESNINRQVHAHDGSVGWLKCRTMAKRLRAINPEAEVVARESFLTQRNAVELLAPGFDAVVDCIDPVNHKCALLVACRDAGIPVVTVGSAGGRRDPARIQCADLGRSIHDPLLARVRKQLRQRHGFPRKDKARFGIPCVFSDEPVKYPEDTGCDGADPDTSLRLDCDSGYGTAAMVTGSFGFFAAALAVEGILTGGAGAQGTT